MKRVAIVQSNYIPWKGYFDLIDSVDEFILYDDAQYTKRDWRNRNQVKTPQGLLWLSIPVEVKGKYEQAIKDTQIQDATWAEKHMLSFRHLYAKAPYAQELFPWLESLYRQAAPLRNLSQVNHLFLQNICQKLEIKTKITWSMKYPVGDVGKTEKLVELCKLSGATHYVSGPAAQAYMDTSLFSSQGISVSYFDYKDYPEYPQLHPPFAHTVSILDLLLNTGPNAITFMKSFARRQVALA